MQLCRFPIVAVLILTTTAFAADAQSDRSAALRDLTASSREPQTSPDQASALINIADLVKVDRSAVTDATVAMSRAVEIANQVVGGSGPNGPLSKCIYLPAGSYRITSPPPPFKGAGCIVGDGPQRTFINLDATFRGDLFQWSEAWTAHKSAGATIRGLRITGAGSKGERQNALMFYDRNDNISVSDLDIFDLPGRAIGTGFVKYTSSPSQAYIRESRFRDVRVFRSGTADVPAVEFTSQGTGQPDGTNEVDVYALDIYGSPGRSLVVSNASEGIVRGLKFDSLRVEGRQPQIGSSTGHLVEITSAPGSRGVTLIFFSNVELLNPGPGTAAIAIGGAIGREAPHEIVIQGWIGGGDPAAAGEGLHIDSGSNIAVSLISLFSKGTNVVIGPSVKHVWIDGAGSEMNWTYRIDPAAANQIFVPARMNLRPLERETKPLTKH